MHDFDVVVYRYCVLLLSIASCVSNILAVRTTVVATCL